MLKEIEESERSVPPLVKIKTGVKVKNQKGFEYPQEVDYFVINPISPMLDRENKPVYDENGKPVMRINENAQRMIRILGTDRPRSLDVIFPTDDLDLIIPTSRFWWKGGKKASKLLCKGDSCYAQYRGDQKVPGMLAMDYSDGDLYKDGAGWNRKCDPTTCPQAQPYGDKPALCKPTMTLKCLLPGVFRFGFVSITTSSWRAINDVYKTLKHYKNPATLASLGLKSIAGIPMTLTRVPASNKDGSANNFLIRITINEDKLDKELESYRLDKPSTFDILKNMEALTMIENSSQAEEEPEYDLLPQSTHGRPQTGDYVVDEATGEVIEADVPKGIEMVEEETPLTIRQSWFNTHPEINTLFNKVAAATGQRATQKKKELTLMKHESPEEAIEYLKSIINKATQQV